MKKILLLAMVFLLTGSTVFASSDDNGNYQLLHGKLIPINDVSSKSLNFFSEDIASGSNVGGLSNYPGYKIVTEEEERNIELKNRNIDRGYVGEGVIIYPSEQQKLLTKKKKGENNSTNTNDYSIMGPIYEDGTTQVVNVTPYTNGTIIQQDQVTGIVENVWNIGMYVVGLFFKTVGSILLDLINYYADTLDKSKGSTTYTFVSYRYIGKDVLVFDSGRWELWYQAKSRESYAHTISSYATASNETMTRRFDYILSNGYDPVKTDFSPNYNNDKELSYRGWYNWYIGYNAYRYPEYGY